MFFFDDPATTDIYTSRPTLSLPAALPLSACGPGGLATALRRCAEARGRFQTIGRGALRGARHAADACTDAGGARRFLAELVGRGCSAPHRSEEHTSDSSH